MFNYKNACKFVLLHFRNFFFSFFIFAFLPTDTSRRALRHIGGGVGGGAHVQKKIGRKASIKCNYSTLCKLNWCSNEFMQNLFVIAFAYDYRTNHIISSAADCALAMLGLT